jgi:UDP-3-O-[3-hydroxymyristoyl] N-acetylglucosamine deacetylase
MHKQHTINESITFIGVGLHTGKNVTAVIKPAGENSGINFIRKDVGYGRGFIAGKWYKVTDTAMSTTISNEHGVSLHTVEHLIAALRGCGVDNALVEIDGPEVPIMDGSAAPFVQTIQKIGLLQQNAPRNIIWIHRPIEYRNGDKYAIMMPENRSRFTVQIEFDNELIGTQVSSFDLTNENIKYISAARTFGFVDQIPELEGRGLIKGGSLSNSVLVDGRRVLNQEGLRYKDEFVRHKILDCIGDFGLIGLQIFGHYYAKKPGHEINHQFIRTLFNRRDAWSYITVEDYHRLLGQHPAMGKRREEQDRISKEDICKAGSVSGC